MRQPALLRIKAVLTIICWYFLATMLTVALSGTSATGVYEMDTCHAVDATHREPLNDPSCSEDTTTNTIEPETEDTEVFSANQPDEATVSTYDTLLETDRYASTSTIDVVDSEKDEAVSHGKTKNAANAMGTAHEADARQEGAESTAAETVGDRNVNVTHDNMPTEDPMLTSKRSVLPLSTADGEDCKQVNPAQDSTRETRNAPSSADDATSIMRTLSTETRPDYKRVDREDIDVSPLTVLTAEAEGAIATEVLSLTAADMSEKIANQPATESSSEGVEDLALEPAVSHGVCVLLTDNDIALHDPTEQMGLNDNSEGYDGQFDKGTMMANDAVLDSREIVDSSYQEDSNEPEGHQMSQESDQGMTSHVAPLDAVYATVAELSAELSITQNDDRTSKFPPNDVARPTEPLVGRENENRTFEPTIQQSEDLRVLSGEDAQISGISTTAKTKVSKNEDANHTHSAGLSPIGTESASDTAETNNKLEGLVAGFNDWAQSFGFPTQHVRAEVVSGGLRVGVFATAALDKGEVYLSVPPEIVMDAQKAESDSEVGPLIASLRSSLAPEGLWTPDKDNLRVLLVAETFVRGRSSKWAPYLSLLPSITEVSRYHPLFFADQAIDLLEGSYLKSAVVRYRSSTISEYDRKFGELNSVGESMKAPFGPHWMTVERYLWATATLDGRVIWWRGKMHLVPLLDLTNCNSGPAGAAVHSTNVDSTGNAVTKAGWRFKKGQQVFEDYGQPNHVLFLHHGFSLGRDNRHDCVRIDAELPRPGPDFPQILDNLKKAFPRGKPMFCVSEKHVRIDFISYVRMMAGLAAVPETTAGFSKSMIGRAVEGPNVLLDDGRDTGDASDNNNNNNNNNNEDGGLIVDGGQGWWSAIDDLQGIEATLTFLESRLKQYPLGSALKSFDDHISGASDDVSYRGNELRRENSHHEADVNEDVKEAVRVFVDSERFVLEKLHDHLVRVLHHHASIPPSADAT